MRRSATTLAVWMGLTLASSVAPCIAQELKQAPELKEAQEPKELKEPRELPVPKPVATDNEMLKKYVWSTLGTDGMLSATVGSAFDQARANPTEWGSNINSAGYARRWVSNYAESAIGDGTKYAVAHIFHQDPAFYRCQCTGFGRRLHHAVDSPFMGRTRTGRRVLSAASIAGIVASHVVPDATWYPAPLGTRDGLKHAGTSLLTSVGTDIIKEFWPRR